MWDQWREIPVSDEVRESAPHMSHVAHIYANSRFEVQCFECATPIGGVTQVIVGRHLHIEPVTWNDMQRIKTELFGVESLATEVYPAEQVDAMKIRIMWVMPKGHQLPYGLDKPSAWGRDAI